METIIILLEERAQDTNVIAAFGSCRGCQSNWIRRTSTTDHYGPMERRDVKGRGIILLPDTLYDKVGLIFLMVFLPSNGNGAREGIKARQNQLSSFNAQCFKQVQQLHLRGTTSCYRHLHISSFALISRLRGFNLSSHIQVLSVASRRCKPRMPQKNHKAIQCYRALHCTTPSITTLLPSLLWYFPRTMLACTMMLAPFLLHQLPAYQLRHCQDDLHAP